MFFFRAFEKTTKKFKLDIERGYIYIDQYIDVNRVTEDQGQRMGLDDLVGQYNRVKIKLLGHGNEADPGGHCKP